MLMIAVYRDKIDHLMLFVIWTAAAVTVSLLSARIAWRLFQIWWLQ